MTELRFAYILNQSKALEAYKQCEKIIRKIEGFGNSCVMEDYGKVDWLQSAKILSFASIKRWSDLIKLEKETKPSEKQLQEWAFDFITKNCAYEIETIYWLEAFRHSCVEHNFAWNLSICDYIASILVVIEGEQYFKYFGHTDQPIFVQ